MEETVEFTLPEFPGQTFIAHRSAVFYQFGEVYPPDVDYGHEGNNHNYYNNNNNSNVNNNGNRNNAHRMNINNGNVHNNINNNAPALKRRRLHGGNGEPIVDIMHPVGVPSMTHDEIEEYYERVAQRVLTDNNILPGDIIYQSVFYESEESSGIQRTEGICIVDINYQGNKYLSPIYENNDSTYSLFHTLLRQINPDFFADVDIALSNLLGMRHPPNTLKDIAMERAAFINQAGGKRRRIVHKKKSSVKRKKTRKSKKRAARKTRRMK